MQYFDQLFNDVSKDEKLNFLKNLLENHEFIKEEFIDHFKAKAEQIRIENASISDLDELLFQFKEDVEDLKSNLETLDFEEVDWDNWHDPGYYVPEYEATEMMAEEEANDFFDSYEQKLIQTIKNGSILDLAYFLSVLYVGADSADINDPYCSLGDPASDYFITLTANIFEENKSKLEERMFTEMDISQSVEFIFKICQAYDKKQEWYLKFIEPFLNQLITDNKIAKFAWQYKNEYQVSLNAVPKLLNEISLLIGDTSLWLENMESCFLKDFETSKQLVDYYYKNSNPLFEEKAKLLFEAFKYESRDFLIDKVDKGSPLHIEILKENITFRASNLSSTLKELKKYLPEKEVWNLIETITDLNHKIHLLALEREFDVIIQLIENEEKKGSMHFSFFDFHKAIKWLYNERPAEAFRLIESHVYKELKVKKGRETYQYIADLLKSAEVIQSHKTQLETLVGNLYNNKPRLPALRDEFNKAGIV